MSDVDLEAAHQQALRQSRESTGKLAAATPAVDFAVQMQSAAHMTNAKQREAAASAGLSASGLSVISAAVKLRGESTSLTQQSPAQGAASSVASAASLTGSSSTQNSNAQLLQATNQLQELNQQFNLQYLQLQENEQQQSRQFTALSNVSKTRNDTAKNSLSNLK